jgi:hypothetical protein
MRLASLIANRTKVPKVSCGYRMVWVWPGVPVGTKRAVGLVGALMRLVSMLANSATVSKVTRWFPEV